MRLPSLVTLVALATSACNLETVSPYGLAGRPAVKGSTDGADAGASGEEASEFGGDAVLASVADGAYKSSAGFAHATKTPYASSAANGAWIDEWVSSEAWAAYATISPAANGSGAKLPVGATIVREVLDANGSVTKLTLMAKGPPGYNPALGDWWFGETDPNGAPLEDDAGLLTGRLSACYSCHLARANDDFLFGVPASAR